MATLDIQTAFREAITRNRVTFGVRGMLTDDDRVLSIGTDTKVLSTIFELFCRPIIQEIADAHGYQVEEAPQTIYPDFTLLTGESDGRKIALDVKTTYRRPDIMFTLGSYTSFLRNGTKNILYPYDQYAAHWVLGFVYDRLDDIQSVIVPMAQRGSVLSPYHSIEYFVQEKYKISGERPGSGNTANIGSIKSRDIQDFIAGSGPFAPYGEEVFRAYWAKYDTKAEGESYRTLKEFLAIHPASKK